MNSHTQPQKTTNQIDQSDDTHAFYIRKYTKSKSARIHFMYEQRVACGQTKSHAIKAAIPQFHKTITIHRKPFCPVISLSLSVSSLFLFCCSSCRLLCLGKSFSSFGEYRVCVRVPSFLLNTQKIYSFSIGLT